MGFGTEILFMLVLGLLLLGPQRLQKMLAHVARAKAEFENASRGFKFQFAAELDAARNDSKAGCSRELVGDERK